MKLRAISDLWRGLCSSVLEACYDTGLTLPFFYGKSVCISDGVVEQLKASLSTSVLMYMPTVYFESRISKPDKAVFGKTESSSQMQK